INKVKGVKGISDYNITPCSNWDNFEKQLEFFYDIVIKTRREHPNKLLLNVMGADMFQNIHHYREINEIMPFIKENTDLSLIVVRHSQNIGEYLSEISDVHIRITIINGTIFLQSLIPCTHLYAI